MALVKRLVYPYCLTYAIRGRKAPKRQKSVLTWIVGALFLFGANRGEILTNEPISKMRLPDVRYMAHK